MEWKQTRKSGRVSVEERKSSCSVTSISQEAISIPWALRKIFKKHSWPLLRVFHNQVRVQISGDSFGCHVHDLNLTSNFLDFPVNLVPKAPYGQFLWPFAVLRFGTSTLFEVAPPVIWTLHVVNTLCGLNLMWLMRLWLSFNWCRCARWIDEWCVNRLNMH